MSSRNAYTAITPEYAAFPIPHTPIPSGLNPLRGASSRFQRSELEYDELSSVQDIPSRLHIWLASAKDFVERNAGLLLFIASQAFLSLMNLVVKVLNSIDPPISALEVCFFSYSTSE